MANYCDITILLDRSGSMQGIKAAMESGFEEFLNQHREVPTTRLSLIQFDGEQPYEEVYIERPITDAPKLSLVPRGMTPLQDALCKTIDRTGKRLARKAEADRPNKVILVVITDGLENASHTFTAADAKRRVEHQTDRYNWEFTFLGANQDAVVEGQKLGFDLNKSITFAMANAGATNVWNSLTKSTTDYARGRTRGLANYTAQERTAAIETDDGQS